MRLSWGFAAVSALVGSPAHAAAPDPAPTLATDAQSGTAALTGPHHLNGAAFSLIVTDWWLAAPIANGQAQDVRLMVEVHLPTYPLLDRATDAAGRKLDVIVLNRGPSARWPRKASERVAVVLPRDTAEQARAAGLQITVTGKARSFAIDVPPQALASFLDGYAQVPGSAAAAPPLAPAAPAPQPASPPSAASAPAPAPSAPAPQPASPPPTASTAPVPSPSLQPAEPAAPAPAPPAPRPIPQIPDAPRPPLVSLPGSATLPPPTADDAPSSSQPADGQASSDSGQGIWVNPLGIQFVPTSSGAMVLQVKPGSIAAAKGIEGGDFIEAVDGAPIKALTGDQMAAKIGAPTAKTLHMIAAGDIRIR